MVVVVVVVVVALSWHHVVTSCYDLTNYNLKKLWSTSTSGPFIQSDLHADIWLLARANMCRVFPTIRRLRRTVKKWSRVKSNPFFFFEVHPWRCIRAAHLLLGTFFMRGHQSRGRKENTAKHKLIVPALLFDLCGPDHRQYHHHHRWRKVLSHSNKHIIISNYPLPNLFSTFGLPILSIPAFAAQDCLLASQPVSWFLQRWVVGDVK